MLLSTAGSLIASNEKSIQPRYGVYTTKEMAVAILSDQHFISNIVLKKKQIVINLTIGFAFSTFFEDANETLIDYRSIYG